MAEMKTACLRALLTLGSCFALCACAGPNEPSVGNVEQAIQGGYVDDETSGVVGLGLFEANHFFVGHCSGTLIAPNLVLTARHCITDIPLDADGTQVECGVTDFRRTREPETLFVSPKTDRPDSPMDPSYVVGRSLHPVPGADDVCGYDVALIVLERNLTPEEAVPIVPRIDLQPSSRESFSAEGYGLTSDDEDATSGRRMRIDDNEVLCSPDQCHLDYPEFVAETEWVSADAGVCSGDSGGPALDARGRVMGVASRGGDECRATIYGDVAYWGDFIIETALEAAREGGYEAPFWTSGSTELADGEAPPVTVVPEVAEEPVVLDEPAQADEQGNGGDIECSAASCGEAEGASDGQPKERDFGAENGCNVRVGGAGFGLGWGFAVALWSLARRRAVARKP